MMVSPPGSPDVGFKSRPQSIMSPTSPDAAKKSRPQSFMYRPSTSQSRPSVGSRHESNSRTSDDDGKTSVRVVVRVRPPLGPSDPGFDHIPQRFQRSMVQVTTPTSLGVESPQGRKLFIFDRVFGEEITQRGIWEYLHESVNSFVQGYNVSIMAYGQSGAGKSYTMGTSGPAEQHDPSAMGIVPRAAANLFEKLTGTPQAHSRQNSGMKMPTRFSVSSMNGILQNGSLQKSDSPWQMTATYVEIYNEQLRDLLLPESATVSERANVSIREDVKGRILLTGLHTIPINSIDDLLAALNHGSAIRQTDATAINAKSSRSHAIFSLNLIQRKPQGSISATKDKRTSSPVEGLAGGDVMVTIDSKLHFVDLAGSERMKNTGASGDRAKEGISINSGLASLGKVIAQLSSRQPGSHVSYRDSKLTRILQDSLGGNAITYMIACITPAEFHLSETLNTVQYAQRARAIQSKPQIQQTSDDSDKQAVIDRLRVEVAFLRQQIRSSENGERPGGGAPERTERQSEREIELQNQLLDVQESYTTLSQRHAKIISEFTKSSDMSGDGALANRVGGESAMDRLKRSRANQEQIEQVVLEYEKTIQSLEASLSNTRSSLSNTESNLMERETKCAYVETINQQLHARVQKLMGREQNNETYLRDLEARLDGQTSGEEKNDAIVLELRKEIARIRESEINAEDYISTLEERLAEADQDMETMQREVERLEHVVERQRSLGKLDNLLFELDHIQQGGERSVNGDMEHFPNVVTSMDYPSHFEDHGALETLKEAEETALPEEEDDELEQPAEVNGDEPVHSHSDGLRELQQATATSTAIKTPSKNLIPSDREMAAPSSAQSHFMAEKFETVNQELVDLRLEHESTVNELDLVSAKYQQALHTLAQMQAELQEVADADYGPARSNAVQRDMDSRPGSFLSDARMNELKSGGHLSSSRSLSSELSLAGESPASTEPSDITPISKQPYATEAEVARLQRLLMEHEQGLNEMSEQYTQLQSEHREALTSVDELKAELQRSKTAGPPSPSIHMPGGFRRMASQNPGSDRGQRSMASLRSIISEEFEGRPDRMDTIEPHLTAAAQELQSRQDRLSTLEAENKTIKKEMETKTAIISGLTRERNSLKSPAPADLSMVSHMRDQLVQSEKETWALREAHALREEEMQCEIQTLKDKIKSGGGGGGGGGGGSLSEDERDSGLSQKVQSLERELKEWQTKHQSTAQLAQTHRKQLLATTAELEAAIASIETMRREQSSQNADSPFERSAVATAMQTEREKHDELVENLKRQVDEHKSTIDQHLNDIATLKAQHASARSLANGHANSLDAKEGQVRDLQQRVTTLEQELAGQRAAVEFHKHGLKSLQDSHASTIEEMKLSHAGAMADIDDRLAELIAQHDHVVKSLKAEADKPRNELTAVLEGAASAMGHSTSSNMIVNHIRDIMEQKNHSEKAIARLNNTNSELERQMTSKGGDFNFEQQLADTNETIAKHQETISRLANEVANHEETLREKDNVIKKRDAAVSVAQAEVQSKARIVEELEQQIESSFDQHHNRLSVVQQQGNQALVEAQARITLLERDLAENRRSTVDSDGGAGASRTNTMKSHRPQSPIDGQARSNSITSNLRKSASAVSLPSPPPAVPLPPLPALPNNLAVNNANANTTTSPSQSRHASKEVPGPEARAQAQLVEDLENRVRTIEKHLHAEKQLTATLEEALVDLETQSNKVRSDSENWKKMAKAAEEELTGLRKERRSERLSIQAVEEEKNKRREAEAARAHLEERMQALSQRKKKKNSLNCF